jgi:hypothetical protein
MARNLLPQFNDEVTRATWIALVSRFLPVLLLACVMIGAETNPEAIALRSADDPTPAPQSLPEYPASQPGDEQSGESGVMVGATDAARRAGRIGFPPPSWVSTLRPQQRHVTVSAVSQPTFFAVRELDNRNGLGAPLRC